METKGGSLTLTISETRSDGLTVRTMKVEDGIAAGLIQAICERYGQVIQETSDARGYVLTITYP